MPASRGHERSSRSGSPLEARTADLSQLLVADAHEHIDTVERVNGDDVHVAVVLLACSTNIAQMNPLNSRAMATFTLFAVLPRSESRRCR